MPHLLSERTDSQDHLTFTRTIFSDSYEIPEGMNNYPTLFHSLIHSLSYFLTLEWSIAAIGVLTLVLFRFSVLFFIRKKFSIMITFFSSLFFYISDLLTKPLNIFWHLNIENYVLATGIYPSFITLSLSILGLLDPRFMFLFSFISLFLSTSSLYLMTVFCIMGFIMKKNVLYLFPILLFLFFRFDMMLLFIPRLIFYTKSFNSTRFIYMFVFTFISFLGLVKTR